MAVRDRRTRWMLGLTTVSALLVFTAGCGGSDNSGGNDADGGGDGTSGLAAYVKCLKEQGIDVPDNLPAGRPSGGPRPDGTAGRPSGGPRPDGSGAPPGFPSGRPSGAPSPGASGRPGGGGPGGPGGGFGNLRPEGVDDATWQKAQDACRSVLPTGGPGRGQNGGGPNGDNGQNGGGQPGAGTAYANCLSDRGVRLTAGLNTADPTVAEALKACQVLSPAPSAGASN